jgi:YHS domain-containing protein
MLRKLLIILTLGFAANLYAADPIYTGKFSNTAVGGYDTVAYFTMDKAVKGSRKHATRYMGATFRFSSAENLQTFLADPDKYAPQYGGYCAWAASQNYTAKGDPEVWKIVDGKLYLNYNSEVQAMWVKDIPDFIKAADANWPGLIDS